jgi:outer membrane receptor for ferrienterochelin and colicin
MNRVVSRLTPAALLLLPVLAFAQSAPKPVEKPATAPASAAEKVVPVEEKEQSSDSKAVKLQSFEVTGSRIRTLGEEQGALPVFTIPQIELERRGVSRLADIRWAIPQLSAAVGFNDNLQNSGTSRAQTVGTSFNLRGLGGNSTLVLVDGKRIPHTGQEAPGGAGGREDFSVDGIPVGAIERIEILPEGAGAIYGSEAIAGVVNIILKKNYTGAELRVSYDNTFKTDVGQTTIGLTAGYRTGKLSTFLTLSYEKQNGLASRDRWFTATADSRVYGAASASFYLSQVASGAGSLSSTSSPQNANQALLPGLTTNIVGIPSGSNGTTAANAAFTTTVPVQYDPNQYSMAIDPATRRSVTFRAEYDHATWAKLYVDGRASEFRNEFTGTPITLSTSLPVGYPGNPFSSAVFLRKVFWDLPLPYTISKQQNKAISAGVRGDFLDTWRYDVGFSLARNVVIDDAVTASGFNFTVLNSLINNADPALRPVLAYDSTKFTSTSLFQSAFLVPDHKDTTDYLQYSIAADGSVWSGWAGDVKLAVGAELGEEKVRFYRDASIATPTFVLTRPFSRDSKATYAEVTIPLLSAKQKIPLVHRFEVGGAVRAQDYEDVGGVTTPTYRALFQPVKWITFRTSRSEGFKPVRLYDLLGPVTTGTTTLTTTSNVRDNRRGGELVLGTFTRSFGGNPTLKPEESVSKNGGIVIDVPGKWFKGLSFSADYYQFTYTDRSGGPGTQVLFDFFPERVTRAAPTAADTAAGFPGQIVTWDATNINLGKVWTKGWDFRASYNRTFDFGDVMLNAAMSDPNVTVTQATPAAVPSSAFGHQPRRLSGSAFWARGVWELGLAVNHQETYFINGLTAAAFPAYTEYNPQASYNFAKDARFSEQSKVWWKRGLAGSKLTVTIINAANNEPDMIDAANGRIVMDPRLRRYIVSFAKKF